MSISSSSHQSNRQTVWLTMTVAAVIAGIAYYHLSRKQPKQSLPSPAKRDRPTPNDAPAPPTNRAAESGASDENLNSKSSAEKNLHLRIEEFDKQGKVLFKEKRFLDAAQAFTVAIDLIESSISDEGTDLSNSLMIRQWIILMNNRSAMYEKANLPELSLEDCTVILERDVDHKKARARKLRLLELLKRWSDALVEVCAIQLLYMKTHRASLRAGLPVPPPPLSPSKLEELVTHLLPHEVETFTQKYFSERSSKARPLPCAYTILQLLRSYTGYNAWMSQAARNGSVDKISLLLDSLPENMDSSALKARRAEILLMRGRRQVYNRDYAAATCDMEEAFALVEGDEIAQQSMEKDTFCRLLEWTGMVRHWHLNLNSALVLYQKCTEREPSNAFILVKQAGVEMDAGKHDEAMKLFNMALEVDPLTVDALFHRANLRVLLGKLDEAKKDLQACLMLRPNHVLARLRLATVLSSTNDAEGAKRELDLAENEDPNSSEVHSYRGELFFTQNEFEEAKQEFETAIRLEPDNPTPYLSLSMAIFNTPPTTPGQLPDTASAIEYLEKAIDVDPQFMAAYLQLGQLLLGTATNLAAARKVINLYDQALANCKTPEEMKDICSMRLMTVAQVEAAAMLKMESFAM